MQKLVVVHFVDQTLAVNFVVQTVVVRFVVQTAVVLVLNYHHNLPVEYNQSMFVESKEKLEHIIELDVNFYAQYFTCCWLRLSFWKFVCLL